MWTCKHCKESFKFEKLSEKANHSRWCDSNPSRDTWIKGRGTTSKFGEIKEFVVECKTCRSLFSVNEREKLFPSRNQYFCSRSCANNRKEWWDKNATHYRNITFKNWPMKCAICDFDRIVAVHHLDHDHSNNDLKNLIPLCPNHHEMAHSKFYDEIKPLIDSVMKERWRE